MHHAGQVVELWRYPIRSIGGERLTVVNLSNAGVHGDREYVLLDRITGIPAAPEKDARWHPALHLSSRRLPDGSSSVVFPDNSELSTSDNLLPEAQSAYFGFPVELAMYDDAVSPHFVSLSSHRLDHSPVHILTSNSLTKLAALCGVSTMDSRRFRPTLVIRTAITDAFEEDKWVGSTISIGQVVMRVKEPTKRCAITFLSQPGLPSEPDILRNILRHNRRHFGFYCDVETPGIIELGDQLHVGDNQI